MITDEERHRKNEDFLFRHVSELIEQARRHIKKAVDTTMVYTYYGIGKYIVENEQQGKDRAGYGKAVLKHLSDRLITRFGDGWSYPNLRNIRQFYLVYSHSINSDYQNKNDRHRLANSSNRAELVNGAYKIGDLREFYNVEPIRQFTLSWSHYLILMRIKNSDERNFYEIECAKQNWSVRQLQRQYNSSLYERLALSRDKDEVMRLAKDGQTVEKPSDVIKSPITLEFLGLKPEAAYTESKLENAIIDKLQDFLLELGKGFLFEARQKRFTFDEDNFYVDLVCYNRLLQCYCLIDLKIDKLTHQDLGQMQMYVNYFDRYVKQDFEKPIYASQYALYLPDKKLLKEKLNEWTAEFEENRVSKE